MTDGNHELRLEILREFLTGVVARTEMAELELPHLVVCSDERGEVTTYSGPFPDVLTALAYAESEAASCSTDPSSDDLTFTVAALYPPED